MQKNNLEYWLRGPIEGVPPLLQPVAHALLQANAEIQELMQGFPKDKLWLRPAGVASVGFHLQHITGVLDRLFTYSRGESLSDAQLSYLQEEGKEQDTISSIILSAALQQQVIASVDYLKTVNQDTLTQVRYVGRRQIPSSEIGLLFHAAEHTMRHTGQLLVTVRILMQ